MKPLIFRERELMKQFNLTATIKVKKDIRVIIGLALIELGCWICGIGFKNE